MRTKANFLQRSIFWLLKLIFLLTGWKEIILVAGLLIVFLASLLSKELLFKPSRLDLYLLAFMAAGVIYGVMILPSFTSVVFGFRYDFLIFLFYFLARAAFIDKR